MLKPIAALFGKVQPAAPASMLDLQHAGASSLTFSRLTVAVPGSCSCDGGSSAPVEAPAPAPAPSGCGGCTCTCSCSCCCLG